MTSNYRFPSFLFSVDSSTIFAYGPTNSGKTFTIRGSGDNWGIMPRSAPDLFELLNTLSFHTYCDFFISCA